MKHRTYFGTGLTGFVGNSLVNEILLRENTLSVTLLTRKQRTHTDSRVQFLEGDITTVQFPQDKFYTDVIHAAAEANDLLAPDKPKYYYDVVEGANRLFAWAKLCQPQRLLFVSSGAVLKGDTTYCRAKRMSETLAPHWSKIARVYSLVGNEMPLNGQYALGRFIGAAIYQKKVEYYDTSSVRSYLHVDDCSRWLLQILDKGQPYRPYDVAATSLIEVSQLAKLVGQIAKVPVTEIAREDFHTTSLNYVSNYLGPTWALGCKETIKLEDAIAQVIAHCRNSNLEPQATR